MKHLGHWWSDHSIEVVEIEGKPYALYGWNGECFLECWECKPSTTETYYDTANKHTYSVTPLYDGEEITGYECRKEK